MGHASKDKKWERMRGLNENENNCIQNALRADPTDISDNMTHFIFILEASALLKAVIEFFPFIPLSYEQTCMY